MSATTVAVVLAVLAFLYSIILIVAIWRTWIPVFKEKNYPNYKQFKAFYVIMWLQIFLTCILYWVMSFKLWQNSFSGDDTLLMIRLVALIYFPTIIMVIDYVIIYWQMYTMFVQSKIQTGSSVKSKYTSQICEKCFYVFLQIFLVLFFVLQTITMIAVAFFLVNDVTFQWELGACTLFLILFFNIWAAVVYFKYTGVPYKEEKFYRNIKHVGLISGLWTFCFLLKFGLGAYDTSIFEEDLENGNVGTAFIIAGAAIVTEFIPYMAVMDTKFIDVFSMRFLSKDASGVNDSERLLIETNSESQLRDTDVERALNLNESDFAPTVTSGEIMRQQSMRKQQSRQDSYRGVKSELKDSVLSSAFSDDRSAINTAPIKLHKAPSESALRVLREKMEERVCIKEKDFVILKPYELQWYMQQDKSRKNKLGAIFECTLKEDDQYLCRVMNFDRVSTYQIDGYFNSLTKLDVLKHKTHLVFPKAVYINEQMSINVILPKKTSLYSLLHAKSETQSIKLYPQVKHLLLIKLAQIMNQLHQGSQDQEFQFFHGHLTSHNVFIEHDPQTQHFKVRIGDLELTELHKYANMFFSYRSANVWSPPECLSQPRKVPDATAAIDVYSFAMLMWEIWHEQVPFDGDLKEATNFVVNQQVRPLIADEQYKENIALGDDSDGEEQQRDPSTIVVKCTTEMADIIRNCWQQDPEMRPDFQHIQHLLQQAYRNMAWSNEEQEPEYKFVQS